MITSHFHGRRAAVLAMATGLSLAALAPASASNDPDYDKQYGVSQVNAPSVWAQKTKGEGVIIAVVDSGVDVDHPDLRAKLVAGRDFSDNDNNADDDSELKDSSDASVKGHGTHVAGIAAAITDNGVGVAGVAPDAKIMPLKVFPSGSGSTFGFAAVPNAIRYAVDNGARVINLSLGTFDTGVPLLGFTQTPCSDALSRGALCVVASGNSGAANPSGYPRDYPGLIVTANDKSGNHAAFGQKADTQWALSAPGQGNWSTVPVEQGGYGNKSGTSMAAPHAAGVAALLFATMKPPANAAGVQQVIDRMLSTARPMGDPGTNGAGRIDAAAAVGVPVIADEPSPTTTANNSAIPQTLNERERERQRQEAAAAGATTVPRPAGGGAAPVATTAAPAPGTAEAPAAPGPTTDPTAPNTKGIKLAGAEDAAGADGDPASSSSTTTLAIVAGVLLVATAGWSGSLASSQFRKKKLKAF